MKTIAVITGDIVSSGLIRDFNREVLLKTLKNTFKEINDEILHESKSPFEIFRGDSFQASIKKPELSLLISMLIRAKLRSLVVDEIDKRRPYRKNWDARVAIGIGEQDFTTKKIIESDGPAFQFSGTTLNTMYETPRRLKIQTPWPDINSELDVSFSFADAIISEWSVFQAEAFYILLLTGNTQKAVAEMLNISGPALHFRLRSGKFESIELFKKHFESLISSRL